MNPPWLLAVALLVGACTADPWSRTRTICGLEEGATHSPTLLAPADDGGRNGLVIEGACAKALLGDIGADPADLVAEVGGGDDLGLYLEDARLGGEPYDGLPVAVWGLYWLLGADYGAVGDLVAGPYVDPGWLQELQDLAPLEDDVDAALAQRIYNQLSRKVKIVHYFEDTGEPLPLAGATEAGELYLPRFHDPERRYSNDPFAADESARTLVHELAHIRPGGLRHVHCGMGWGESGEKCDTGVDGAHGLALTAGWAEALAATDGRACLEWSENPEGAARAQAIERSMQGSFDAFILAPNPGYQLLDCP